MFYLSDLSNIMAHSSKTKKTRKSYTIPFKIRVVMKALENNRNIAKTAREFGILRKQVGGPNGQLCSCECRQD